MHRIAIIGGGPGGLMTADQLARGSGRDITIFEEAETPGGKLRTRQFTTAPVPYESGAAEIYDYSMAGDDPLRRLLDELGLTLRPIAGGGMVLHGRLLRDENDLARWYGRATLEQVRAFRRRAAALLPLEAWHPGSWRTAARHPWTWRRCAELLDEVTDPVARTWIAAASHADMATEPHLTDGLTGLQNLVMDVPGYVQCRAIEGGMSRLAERLTERADGARILCNRRVSQVARAGGRWLVTSEHDGRSATYEFDAVVLALPLTQLGGLVFEGEALRRAMDRHFARFDRPGHYLRVSMLFRSRFWAGRMSGSWFTLDAFRGTCVYDESARFDTGELGVLGFLLAGNEALRLSNLEDTALVRRVLSALPAPWQPAATEQLLEARVHRWCGAVSGQPGGHPPCEPRTTHEPDPDLLPGLILVGDYLFDSTLNGVHRSAELAARLLSARLAARRAAVPAAVRQLAAVG